jgi:Enoyl-(Acyl carrier protein) reductase
MIHRLESAISPDDPGGFGDRYQSALPTGRYGTADEIANLVLFLCSDLASNITGAQYVSDGGLHCNGWVSDGQLGFSLALDSGLQLNVIEYIASAILRPNILRNFQRNHHDSPHSPPQTSGQPARRNGAMMELSEHRIEQLEKLVSSLRHDVRGIVTPVALAAHHLHKKGDPVSQHSAAMIDKMIERLVLRLNSTYGLVPPSSGVAAAPLSLLVLHAVDEAKAPIPAA